MNIWFWLSVLLSVLATVVHTRTPTFVQTVGSDSDVSNSMQHQECG